VGKKSICAPKALFALFAPSGMAPMLAQDRRLPARFRTTETPAVKKAPVASKQARAPICAVDLGPSP